MAKLLDPNLYQDSGIGKTRYLDENDLPLEMEGEMPIAPVPMQRMPAASSFPSLASLSPQEMPQPEANMQEMEFDAALSKARDSEGQNNLMKAANALLVGSAAYSGAKPDLSAANAAIDASTNLARSKASDIQTKEKFGQDILTGKAAKNKFDRTTREEDPNSDTSRAFRKSVENLSPELVKRYGADWEKVSAADKNDIWDAVKLKETIDARKQLAQDSAAAKKELAREKADAKKASEPLTAGRKKLDQDFAQDYNEWTSGGAATLDKNISRLEEAKLKLKASEAGGRFSGRLPDVMKSEDLITIRDDVHAAAVAGLRAALGAQFTEKEGERIQGYSFNQNLSPEQNEEKINAAIKELKAQKAQKAAKAKFFEDSGTLTGFKVDSVPSEEALETKVVKGVTYQKVPGGWKAVK